MAIEIPKPFTFEETVFRVNNCAAFEETALKVFRFQYQNNLLYRQYCEALHTNPAQVNELVKIPFLPVSFFKTHTVVSTPFKPQLTFSSSGTTGSTTSFHHVKNISLYEQSFLAAFEHFYGSVKDYCILGLLPSYLERQGSSLVYMADKLIQWSGHPLSRFYLHDFDQLAEALQVLENKGKKTLLIGVTYALLDFAALHPMPLSHTIIMETGGMKGRKQELIRSEVHEELKKAFTVAQIHSEYGMTELLSQAYAFEEGFFQTPAWMKVLIRDEDDPFQISVQTKDSVSGGINIIDLANLYSCSFIAVEDVGKLHKDNRFEVLGRMDNSDLRGCSLLAV